MNRFFLFIFLILILCLGGCKKNGIYNIGDDIKDVTNMKINNEEYLSDILEYDKNDSENENVYLALEDSFYYNDCDFSNVDITFVNTKEIVKFKDYIKPNTSTLIIRLSAYCEYCKNMPSKEMFDKFKDSDFNILFWCEGIGIEDQLKYIEELGIDKNYVVTFNLSEKLYELNDLGFPCAIFLNYENKIKIVFQSIKPSTLFSENLLKKLTKENY